VSDTIVLPSEAASTISGASAAAMLQLVLPKAGVGALALAGLHFTLQGTTVTTDAQLVAPVVGVMLTTVTPGGYGPWGNIVTDGALPLPLFV